MSAASSIAVEEQSIPDQYELLLAKLSCAERGLDGDGRHGYQMYLEEASGVVFDLLYSLDFRNGGELVPRLAGLYGYIANELLNISSTGDRATLRHLQDMINTLKQSWNGSHLVA